MHACTDPFAVEVVPVAASVKTKLGKGTPAKE